MDFDFAVRATRPNPAFEVTPAAGVVPAGGVAEVAVTFRPLALVTEEMRIEVSVQCIALVLAPIKKANLGSWIIRQPSVHGYWWKICMQGGSR